MYKITIEALSEDRKKAYASNGMCYEVAGNVPLYPGAETYTDGKIIIGNFLTAGEPVLQGNYPKLIYLNKEFFYYIKNKEAKEETDASESGITIIGNYNKPGLIINEENENVIEACVMNDVNGKSVAKLCADEETAWDEHNEYSRYWKYDGHESYQLRYLGLYKCWDDEWHNRKASGNSEMYQKSLTLNLHINNAIKQIVFTTDDFPDIWNRYFYISDTKILEHFKSEYLISNKRGDQVPVIGDWYYELPEEQHFSILDISINNVSIDAKNKNIYFVFKSIMSGNGYINIFATKDYLYRKYYVLDWVILKKYFRIDENNNIVYRFEQGNKNNELLEEYADYVKNSGRKGEVVDGYVKSETYVTVGFMEYRYTFSTGPDYYMYYIVAINPKTQMIDNYKIGTTGTYNRLTELISYSVTTYCQSYNLVTYNYNSNSIINNAVLYYKGYGKSGYDYIYDDDVINQREYIINGNIKHIWNGNKVQSAIMEQDREIFRVDYLVSSVKKSNGKYYCVAYDYQYNDSLTFVWDNVEGKIEHEDRSRMNYRYAWDMSDRLTFNGDETLKDHIIRTFTIPSTPFANKVKQKLKIHQE